MGWCKVILGGIELGKETLGLFVSAWHGQRHSVTRPGCQVRMTFFGEAEESGGVRAQFHARSLTRLKDAGFRDDAVEIKRRLDDASMD